MLRYDDNLQIKDERCPDDLIFNEGKISVCYTLKTDDITHGEKPSGTPYTDRTGAFVIGKGFEDRVSKTRLKIQPFLNGLSFVAEHDNEALSEWGLNLPFNFMGKLNGGDFTRQFLFNSPYISQDKKLMSFYLTKPNGNNLILFLKSGGVGWKMDYSPYHAGHFFVNLKVFGSFDKAYDYKEKNRRIELILLPVADYFDALSQMAEVLKIPFIYPVLSVGKIGEGTKILSFGKVDSIMEEHGDSVRPITGDYLFSTEGESTLVPFCNGERGIGVTVYGFSSLTELYKKSMDTVDLSVVAETDGNLCEHQCWASAMLRFLTDYKEQLSADEIKTYENKALRLLSVVTEKDPEKAVARRTILDKPFKEYPAYNVFCSRRIQEQFFGITLLLDAYRYFNDKEYLDYAVGAIDCLIDNYQKSDGRIETSQCGEKEDYTTVCCAMIPFVDMAVFLKHVRPELSKKYFEAARKMAEYLYDRGLYFPTEGGDCGRIEMEDGSISCTALSLLYYCKNVNNEPRYLKKAKEILDLHDNWVIKTPICQMHGSSLRWWETLWEGDKDGPAICCGHAWTIWRAEADYLYYTLTKDEAYLIKAKNGFGTNLSKIQSDGTTYSIYNVDEINGGGFCTRSEEIKFKLAGRFAKTVDCDLSRYVWIRANDTLLNNN